MAETYSQISTTTFASAASSATFSSIPATFTDLRMVIYVPTSASSSGDFSARFNGATGNVYRDHSLQSNGTAVSSNPSSGSTVYLSNANIITSNTYPVFITLDIMNYTSSKYKGYLIVGSGNRDSTGSVTRAGGTFLDTTAISSILISSTVNFSIGTQMSLYGIKAA